MTTQKPSLKRSLPPFIVCLSCVLSCFSFTLPLCSSLLVCFTHVFLPFLPVYSYFFSLSCKFLSRFESTVLDRSPTHQCRLSPHSSLSTSFSLALFLCLSVYFFFLYLSLCFFLSVFLLFIFVSLFVSFFLGLFLSSLIFSISLFFLLLLLLSHSLSFFLS